MQPGLEPANGWESNRDRTLSENVAGTKHRDEDHDEVHL